MEAGKIIKEVRAHLIEATRLLDTELSAEIPETEYIACIQCIRKYPAFRKDFALLLITMYENREIFYDTVSYLMFVLRWKEIYIWAEYKRDTVDYPITYAKPYIEILDAYSDSWEYHYYYSYVLEERTRQIEIDKANLTLCE